MYKSNERNDILNHVILRISFINIEITSKLPTTAVTQTENQDYMIYKLYFDSL